MRRGAFSALVLAGGLGWAIFSGATAPLAAQGDGKKSAGVLTVVDNAGKEVKLTGWKFLSGTRPLTWLAPAGKAKDEPKKGAKKTEEEEAAAGPEALEVREENSTTFQNGILTLVPLESVKRIDYDPEKKTVQVTYLKTGAKGAEEGTLTGSTRFVGVNKISLQGEADLGELGKAALKFQGGTPKGVRSLQFPSPKPVPAPTGRPAVITANDKQKTRHEVTDLQALFLKARGKAEVSPTLHFKTTVKLDLAKVRKLRLVEPASKKVTSYDFEVTLKDGKQHTLTLLTKSPQADGKLWQLEGLVGRAASGYKLFPAHTIRELQLDGAEAVPENEKKAPKRPQ